MGPTKDSLYVWFDYDSVSKEEPFHSESEGCWQPTFFKQKKIFSFGVFVSLVEKLIIC